MQKQYLKGLVTKSVDGKYKVLASTSAIDRQGDSIDQSGWDLTNFKKNPVMPWAHDYTELPVAKVTSIEVTQLGLEAEFEFAPAEGNPKAQQIKVLYDNGYLNAVSVGFIPKERNGKSITKSELLEISFVPVPANQEALRLAFKDLDTTLLPELKGAVEENLAAQDAYEQKWEKWDEISEVLGAMWSVYFDEATPVEDFSKLLNESITLLQTIAGTDGAEEDMTDAVQNAIGAENTKAFVENMVAKSGRTLSKKTLENIDNAITSMKDATTVLEALKEASAADEQDGKSDAPADNAESKKVEEVEGIVLSYDDMKIIRRSLINADKTNELGLSVVNAFLKEKGVKI